MRPDDPRHGSTRGATAHYREGSELCPPCREARRIACRRNKKNRRRGWSGYVPINKTQRHLKELQRLGWSYVTIAELSGVSTGSISRIATGDVATTLTRNAARIQAIPLRPREATTIPAWRVQRRLQALQAIGWSLAEIGRRTGWSAQNLNALLANRWRDREEVTLRTFELIDTAYREMAMRPPAEDRWVKAVRSRAASKGWRSPMLWDDIDDIDENPALEDVCSNGRCAGSVVALGLCRTHYNAQARGKAA